MHRGTSSSSKGTISKALYVDASYDKNTKSFQRNQQRTKPRSLTLGEVSHEIHHLKKEIVELKTKMEKMEKRKRKRDKARRLSDKSQCRDLRRETT